MFCELLPTDKKGSILNSFFMIVYNAQSRQRILLQWVKILAYLKDSGQ